MICNASTICAQERAAQLRQVEAENHRATHDLCGELAQCTTRPRAY